jgi:hypothetical protein
MIQHNFKFPIEIRWNHAQFRNVIDTILSLEFSGLDFEFTILFYIKEILPLEMDKFLVFRFEPPTIAKSKYHLQFLCTY